MNEQQLAEIEARWAKWINPKSAPKTLGGDFLILLAEIERLNRMVDKSCEMLIDKFWCANALGLPAFTNCPPDDDEGDCLDCVRKYLESEVTK